MEKLVLILQSTEKVKHYLDNNHMQHHEAAILEELLNAIVAGNEYEIQWINSFGDSLGAIIMNIYADRKGLEFGFTEIAFDPHAWFKRPEWLAKEDLDFGDTSRYGNYSTIYLGHGRNHVWTYAMDHNFGIAGGGYY